MGHVVMYAFIAIVVFLVFWSRNRAIEKGLLWFGWSKNTVKPAAAYYQHRTESIETRSKASGQHRTGIKPKSPWLERPRAKAQPSAVYPARPLRQKGNGAVESSALKKLAALTHSPEVSARLVLSVSQKNPGRTQLWCVEKAIYDIERDRMAR